MPVAKLFRMLVLAASLAVLLAPGTHAAVWQNNKGMYSPAYGGTFTATASVPVRFRVLASTTTCLGAVATGTLATGPVGLATWPGAITGTMTFSCRTPPPSIPYQIVCPFAF